jgi:hypothetical protein
VLVVQILKCMNDRAGPALGAAADLLQRLAADAEEHAAGGQQVAGLQGGLQPGPQLEQLLGPWAKRRPGVLGQPAGPRQRPQAFDSLRHRLQPQEGIDRRQQGMLQGFRRIAVQQLGGFESALQQPGQDRRQLASREGPEQLGPLRVAGGPGQRVGDRPGLEGQTQAFIDHHESGVDAGLGRMAAQDLGAQAVDGGDPAASIRASISTRLPAHPARRPDRDRLADAVAHLARPSR